MGTNLPHRNNDRYGYLWYDLYIGNRKSYMESPTVQLTLDGQIIYFSMSCININKYQLFLLYIAHESHDCPESLRLSSWTPKNTK